MLILNSKILITLGLLVITNFASQINAQSLPLSTDRARVHVAEIIDPTDSSKKLKVLRTDANTPLRNCQ